jgi:hypothetical protein
MPDGPKFRDGTGEGRTRVPDAPAKTDENAHALRTLPDASPAGRRVTPPGVKHETAPDPVAEPGALMVRPSVEISVAHRLEVVVRHVLGHILPKA